MVALVRTKLNGYSRAAALLFSLAAPSLAVTSVEGSCKGAPLDDELKGKASSLMGSPLAAAMSARSVRVTSWKSGSARRLGGNQRLLRCKNPGNIPNSTSASSMTTHSTF
jgi:hypothetical protein